MGATPANKRTRSRAGALAPALGLVAVTVGVAVAAPQAGTAVTAPMVCSRGPGGKHFSVSVSLPPSVAQASTYGVRLDGVPTGKISGFGLNYTHDIAVDYVIPPGAAYVEGSAHVVPGTGTPNVTDGARVWHEAGLLRMLMPGRVESGTGYTSPSIEFQLTARAPVGASLALELSQYRVIANAIVVGDVSATCEPTPKPYTLGTTLVTAPAPSAPAP
jgi:hypothetical protein